jgi:hypothetical protein
MYGTSDSVGLIVVVVHTPFRCIVHNEKFGSKKQPYLAAATTKIERHLALCWEK